MNSATHSTLFVVMILSAIATTGCSDEDPTFEELMLERSQQPGITDCGSFVISNVSSCGLSEAETCAVEAFRSCAPAVVRITQITVEGAAIPRGWIIGQGRGPTPGCGVTELIDHSADSFKGDYGDLQEYRCETVEHVEGDCSFATVRDCTLLREW